MERKAKKRRTGCYHCGSSSHRAKNCPNSDCRLCGKRGHDAGGCPTRRPPPVDLGQFQSSSEINNDNRFSFVELFAGMGGFRVALDKLGGRCAFASEIDRFCVRNYQDNFGDRLAGDICRIEADKIPNHDLLVGGFPCQPFSSSGSRLGMKDPKGILFREIVRVLKSKKPSAFLLENVRGLFLHNKGETLKLVVKEFESCDYNVKYSLVDAATLLPQERCRLFFVGVRKDLPSASTEFCFPAIPHLHRGVEDIIHDEEEALDLERLTLNANQISKVKSQRYTQERPEARFLSDFSLAAKTIQSSYTKYMVGSQFVPVSSGNGNDWRRFSSREAARLQGFPESFQLCKDRAYHMIGNAVSPPVIAMIAAALLRHIGIAEKKVEKSWGWEVTQKILLEAITKDGMHREDLRRKISAVSDSFEC
mmetsp:Transcript_9916/g.14945  ORF Transcript_9916/g.14945 Transcript_9916/m.14945 type:complete len:421 (+) Transcript_9916:236-1498(+)